MNTETKAKLKQRFTLLCKRFAEAKQLTDIDAKIEKWWKVLDECYSASQRAYHNWEHIAACLSELDKVIDFFDNPLAAEAAIFFHDAKYDPFATDNEAVSAEMLGEFYADFGWPDEVAKRLTICTDHRLVSKDNDEQLICDIDLSILGQPWPRYICYAQDIRQEYQAVPLAAYRAKRIDVLKKLRDREPLFQTEHFQRQYKLRADSNLTAEIMALSHEKFPNY